MSVILILNLLGVLGLELSAVLAFCDEVSVNSLDDNVPSSIGSGQSLLDSGGLGGFLAVLVSQILVPDVV